MKLLFSIARDLFIALVAFLLILCWGCASNRQLARDKERAIESAPLANADEEGNPVPSRRVPDPEIWYLQKAPSTYYPVGLPSDFPTTAGNSEWFPMEIGTFLIPVNGVNGHSHEDLLEMARNELTEREIQQLRTKRAVDTAEGVAVGVVLLPPGILFSLCNGCMGNPY